MISIPHVEKLRTCDLAGNKALNFHLAIKFEVLRKGGQHMELPEECLLLRRQCADMQVGFNNSVLLCLYLDMCQASQCSDSTADLW